MDKVELSQEEFDKLYTIKEDTPQEDIPEPELTTKQQFEKFTEDSDKDFFNSDANETVTTIYQDDDITIEEIE